MSVAGGPLLWGPTYVDAHPTADERDAAAARFETMSSDVAALSARMGDTEARAATEARDYALALAALRERLSAAEAARDACRVDLAAAEARALALREQVLASAAIYMLAKDDPFFRMCTRFPCVSLSVSLGSCCSCCRSDAR